MIAESFSRTSPFVIPYMDLRFCFPVTASNPMVYFPSHRPSLRFMMLPAPLALLLLLRICLLSERAGLPWWGQAYNSAARHNGQI